MPEAGEGKGNEASPQGRDVFSFHNVVCIGESCCCALFAKAVIQGDESPLSQHPPIYRDEKGDTHHGASNCCCCFFFLLSQQSSHNMSGILSLIMYYVPMHM